MSAIVTVAPGTIVLRNNQPMVVLRFVEPDVVRVRNLMVREEQDAHISELQPQIDDKAIHTTRDVIEIDDEQWEDAIRTYNLIRPLLDNPTRTKPDVDAVADQAGVTYVTVYRWLHKFESTGLVSSLVRKRRNDVGKPRIDPKAEKLLAKIVNDELLTKRRKGVKKAHNQLKLLCRKADVPVPNISTLRRRYTVIAPEVREKRRMGPEAARKFKPIEGTVPYADYPYALLEIDHTKCDIELVDSVHRLPVGRPWITLAIDVFSRMVVGYYVSFDPPGMLGTGLCIANAILSKEAFLAKLGLDYEWPCQGLPTAIHLDNAREFRGNTLKKACEEYGINLHFRKVKTPQYGGHIERMLGTLLKEMHAAPGTTFSNPKEKGEFDSAADAAMTLEDFERWLANLILGAYHNRVHSGLGVPPMLRYKQGILGTNDTPGTGLVRMATDPERLRINFLPMEERIVQPMGIVIDKIWYFSDVLRPWIGAVEPGSLTRKRKLLVRRDPRDISFIYFYDPDLEQYFRIPYRDMAHPALSLWELRTIQGFLANQGKEAEDEEAIFRALEEMVRIEEESIRQTRKARIANERKRRHQAQPIVDATKAESPADLDDETASPTPSGEILPFDEIEPM